MVAWAVPAVMSVISLIQGTAGSLQNQRNAASVRAWGEYNAAMARKYAAFDAKSIEKLASINSFLVDASVDVNSKITEAIAQYNATLRVQTAEYNAQLLEKEAALVWQSQELDQVLFEREASIFKKDLRAKFASSGVEINTGSPVDYMVDQSTQLNLESFIIRHNAEIEMGKLLDAAALGRWQGEAEAAAIIYQGQMDSLTMKSQGAIQVSQINAQAAYDAIMTRFSGDVKASQILSDSEWKASQYETAGTNSLLEGLFRSVSWLTRGYGVNSVLSLSDSTGSYFEDLNALQSATTSFIY